MSGAPGPLGLSSRPDSVAASGHYQSGLNVCAVCSKADKLLRCSRCKSAVYCSKEHQRLDWKRHKESCAKNNNTSNSTRPNLKEDSVNLPNYFSRRTSDKKLSTDSRPPNGGKESEPVNGWTSPITEQGSSEATILGARAEQLNPALESGGSEERERELESEMPTEMRHNGLRNFPEVSLVEGDTGDDLLPPFLHRNNNHMDDHIIDGICRNVIRDMDKYGVCVVDKFLGPTKGSMVLKEVLNMYSAGLFRDGQLVSNRGGASNLKTIRGDQITWLDGKEKQCQHIGMLISQVDAVIMRANRMLGNGKMGDYTINGRTKVRI